MSDQSLQHDIQAEIERLEALECRSGSWRFEKTTAYHTGNWWRRRVASVLALIPGHPEYRDRVRAEIADAVKTYGRLYEYLPFATPEVKIAFRLRYRAAVESVKLAEVTGNQLGVLVACLLLLAWTAWIVWLIPVDPFRHFGNFRRESTNPARSACGVAVFAIALFASTSLATRWNRGRRLEADNDIGWTALMVPFGLIGAIGIHQWAVGNLITAVILTTSLVYGAGIYITIVLTALVIVACQRAHMARQPQNWVIVHLFEVVWRLDKRGLINPLAAPDFIADIVRNLDVVAYVFDASFAKRFRSRSSETRDWFESTAHEIANGVRGLQRLAMSRMDRSFNLLTFKVNRAFVACLDGAWGELDRRASSVAEFRKRWFHRILDSVRAVMVGLLPGLAFWVWHSRTHVLPGTYVAYVSGVLVLWAVFCVISATDPTVPLKVGSFKDAINTIVGASRKSP